MNNPIRLVKQFSKDESAIKVRLYHGRYNADDMITIAFLKVLEENLEIIKSNEDIKEAEHSIGLDSRKVRLFDKSYEKEHYWYRDFINSGLTATSASILWDKKGREILEFLNVRTNNNSDQIILIEQIYIFMQKLDRFFNLMDIPKPDYDLFTAMNHAYRCIFGDSSMEEAVRMNTATTLTIAILKKMFMQMKNRIDRKSIGLMVKMFNFKEEEIVRMKLIDMLRSLE